MIKTILLDARTSSEVLGRALNNFAEADLLGLDCETQQRNRHSGLEHLRKLIFDHRRTVMTGFSWYSQGSDVAYYVNLNHADVENRLPDTFVENLFALRKPDSLIICHNAPYELTMFKQCYGIELKDIVCSMQLAVTHHGPDNYDIQTFNRTPINGMRPIVPAILAEFAGYDPAQHGRNLNAEQAFVYGQFAGKSSDAHHSYNGFVKSISYGYGLKNLVKRIFNHDMITYEEVVGDGDMADLTGEETVAYGADDAYWCVRVYQHLYDDLLKNDPKALVTFFEQENPMIHVYSNCWIGGIRLNLPEIEARQTLERQHFAEMLRQIKVSLKELLPFPDEPNKEMMEHQANWYPKSYQKKRQQIIDWVNSPDCTDDYEQVTQVSNPIGNAWSGLKGSGRFNLTYWQSMRTILHDLMGHKLVKIANKVATDADARSRMLKTWEKSGEEKKVKFLNLITEMVGVEQAMKLYITPYTHLLDPETGRVYPTINSMLASRRMAMQNPNGMQLAKNNKAINYVRSYFLPDHEDHVVLSADWSSVELVLIGEYSGDAEFAKVFGQIPYGDLHTGAAADCLSVATLTGLTESEFRGFKLGENPQDRILRDLDGTTLDPQPYFKYMRNTIGKPANFNYWYSGALATVGEILGWSTDQMWAAGDRYRDRFWGAEEWRVATQELCAKQGYIELPDGHRRERYEATPAWAMNMVRKFANISAGPAMLNFGNLFIRGMQSRAKNQAVNTMIQGSCAGMAKRAILTILATADQRLFRFMKPIHDELVFSVHKDYVLEFIPLLRAAMNHQPVFVKNLPLHCTVAIGKTFGVNDQIELDEASYIEGVVPKELVGQPLPEVYIQKVLDYITDRNNI